MTLSALTSKFGGTVRPICSAFSIAKALCLFHRYYKLSSQIFFQVQKDLGAKRRATDLVILLGGTPGWNIL